MRNGALQILSRRFRFRFSKGAEIGFRFFRLMECPIGIGADRMGLEGIRIDLERGVTISQRFLELRLLIISVRAPGERLARVRIKSNRHRKIGDCLVGFRFIERRQATDFIRLPEFLLEMNRLRRGRNRFRRAGAERQRQKAFS